jgi:hypothetical protein
MLCGAGSLEGEGRCECESSYVAEDICRVPYQVKSDENSVLLLTFSSPLKPGLTSDDLALSTDSTAAVTYRLSPSDSASAYFLNYEISPTPNSSVTLGLVINSSITDLYDVPISRQQRQVQLNFSKPSAASSSTSSTASAGQITSIALVGGAALTGMFVGNPQSMFVLLSMLQFASLIPLMHFSISDELSSLLKGNNPFDSLPNIAMLVLEPDWFPEPYAKAKHYGFETAGFLFNIGQELSVLALTLLVLLGLYLGSKCECCFSFKQYCSKKLASLTSSIIPGYLQGCFTELLVATLIQLRSQGYFPWFRAVSCFCAWTFLMCGFLGSLLLVVGSFRESRSSLLSSFFAGLSASAWARLQVPAFYVHRLVVVLVITLSYDCHVQGFVCLAASLLVSSSQKFFVVCAGMLRLKSDWSLLLVEAADWVSMIVLLVYAYHPSLEYSLGMINLFYGIIFSILTVTTLSTLRKLIVFCRKPQALRIEV